MEKCKLKLRFSNHLVVDSGQKRRAHFVVDHWDTSHHKKYSSNHIHASKLDNTPTTTNFCWDFTRVYGFLKANNKHRTWERIRSIHGQSQDKWLVCRDFNEIKFQEEKWGKKQKTENHLSNFLSMVKDYELADLGYMRPKFTWCNNWEGGACISERLERCLASTD